MKHLSLKLILGIFALVILVLGTVFGANYYKQYRYQQQVKQERIMREKKRKQDEIHFRKQASEDIKKTKDPISVSIARKNVIKAMGLGFKAITASKAVSGDNIDINDLSDSFKSQLDKFYKTTNVLQEFDDIVNVASNNSEGIYGQGGHNKAVKKPTAGCKYIVDECSVTQENSSQDDDYKFSIEMKYHPQGFSTMQVKLSATVDSFSGKVSEFEQDSIGQ